MSPTAPRKPATRKDVARLAGVSETVVSYVLNNNRYVAQDKRERVLQVQVPLLWVQVRELLLLCLPLLLRYKHFH